jgi:hypothetical protein
MRMNKPVSMADVMEVQRQTSRSPQTLPVRRHMDQQASVAPQDASQGRAARARGGVTQDPAARMAWHETEWSETAFEPRAI